MARMVLVVVMAARSESTSTRIRPTSFRVLSGTSREEEEVQLAIMARAVQLGKAVAAVVD